MLCGRDAECSVIAELLAAARQARGGVLVVRGEPGIGKSALLREAREQAVDMQVLEGFGIESEAQLPFAGLHQLLRPVFDHVRNLPRPQAAALHSALGLDAAGTASPFLVYLAALTLLSDVAGERPLLCLVDDGQWFDDASADALAFVARRLDAEPIVMLLAARDGEGDRFDVASLPELRLAGLDARSAGELLDRNAPVPLAPALRCRLIEGTGGNPLALLELPSTMSDAQRSGTEPMLDPLPVGTRVERAFLARVRRLPEDTQALLLVAAADDTGRLAVVLDAAARLGVGVSAVDPAERDGLVLVQGGRIELRHPLVRSAIYQAAPLSQRQMVHGALASALDADADADRRAWHRAAASATPDPRVIGELEEAARRARKQSGYSAASRAFERAASLTTSAGTRARLLTAAADNAWWAGQLDRGRMLVEAARPLVVDPALRAELDRLHGLIEWTGGVPAEACELLIRAARDASPGDALLLLAVASNAAEYAGDPALVVAIGELAGGLAVEASPFLQLVRHVLVGLDAVAEGNFDAAVRPLRRAVEVADDLEDDGPSEFPTPSGLSVVEQPVPLLFAGRAALHLGDDDAAHRLHRRAAMQARSSGASSILTQVLPRLALCELWAGRWPSAAASAKEGLALAQDIGQGTVGAHLLAVAALLSALRGDEDECRSQAEASRERATSRGLTLVDDLTNWALTVLELGLGRPAEAFDHARRIVALPTIAWAAADRVEAAAHAGEPSLGAHWLEPFAAWADAVASPWSRATALHCRAILAEDSTAATDLFSAALDAHASAARPFERARTELALGALLRRSRRRIDARRHLQEALDAFEGLGAATWAERARVELRASGRTARHRDPSTIDQLTEQEVQIAGFVAEGLTNRDVAAHLFVSPRTVDFHLRNIFRKLGITSRTELARLDLGTNARIAR